MRFLSLLRCTAVAGSLLAAVAAHAQTVLERVSASGVVRVCIWPEYYGVTYRHARTQELGA